MIHRNSVQILVFLLLICGIFNLNAQSTNKKAQENFNRAQEMITQINYPQAIDFLKAAVKEDEQFQLAYLQLADLHRKTRQYNSSIPYYEQAIKLGNISDYRVYYGMGESFLLTGNYENAKSSLTTFVSKYTGKDKDIVNKANKYIKDCEFSVAALKSPVKYEPVNLGSGVNSKYRDYFPSITADGKNLIFSRNVEGNEDFYLATKTGSTWSEAIPLSNKINTPNYNEGAQSISPDGMYLFFTGCNRPDGLGRCDIYVSHKEGNDWGTPFNLGAPVNSEYWDAQPSISPDGNTLYFVSNRPGGYGGYDIWKSTLNEDGSWQKPVNLGPEINTPYDEQTPFIHPDGKTFYFSSDGWPGFGNKDIFMSTLTDNGHWTVPVNLGTPINTFNEETGLAVSPDGSKAYFSAILKDGYGDMDIYQFDLPPAIRPKEITYVKGNVKDKETGKPLSASIKVVNLQSKQNQFNDFTNEATGAFLAVMPAGHSYLLNAEAEGYLFYSDNFELNNGSSLKPYELNIFLEKIKPGVNIVLRNIFFDTNKYELLPSSVTELNLLTDLLQHNKGLRIEIQGHTDNIGNKVQNMKLSELRAKSVYDFLIMHQITKERLLYKGYGEDKPLATNETEAGRKQNRRTSFVVTQAN